MEFGSGLIPAANLFTGAYTAITGRTFFTNHEVSGFDRYGAIVPGFRQGRAVYKAANGLGTSAQRLADKVRNLSAGKRPNTVAVLRTKGGRLVAGRNGIEPTNPKLGQALNNVSRNVFQGSCAEAACIGRALDKGLDIKGSRITTSNVRGPSSASGIHGTSKAPCSVCQRLLDFFDIKNGNP